jgi:hypothetical protein
MEFGAARRPRQQVQAQERVRGVAGGGVQVEDAHLDAPAPERVGLGQRERDGVGLEGGFGKPRVQEAVAVEGGQAGCGGGACHERST